MSLAVSLTRCIVSRAVPFTVSVACDTRLPGESRCEISSIVSLISARFCSISARISAVSGVVSVLSSTLRVSRVVDVTVGVADGAAGRRDPYGYAPVAGVSGSAPVMPRPDDVRIAATHHVVVPRRVEAPRVVSQVLWPFAHAAFSFSVSMVSVGVRLSRCSPEIPRWTNR